MRTVSRVVGALGAVVCMGAAVVMTAATFLPYTGGNWGDGLLTGGEAATPTTVNIIGGSDVWLVLGTVVTLGFVAAFHLGGVRRQTSAFIALAISVVALGMALKLPGTWMQDGVVYGELPSLLRVLRVPRRRGGSGRGRAADGRHQLRGLACKDCGASVSVGLLSPAQADAR